MKWINAPDGSIIRVDEQEDSLLKMWFFDWFEWVLIPFIEKKMARLAEQNDKKTKTKTKTVEIKAQKPKITKKRRKEINQNIMIFFLVFILFVIIMLFIKGGMR